MNKCDTCGLELTFERLETCICRTVDSNRVGSTELSALDTQVAGDHYRKLGAYQPWEVLRRWLTPEEFRGYMKGTAIAYLAREKDKGGSVDVEKALHTLQGMIELEGRKE